MKILLSLSLFSLLFCGFSFGQEELYGGDKHRIGVLFGIADQDIGGLALDVNYNHELRQYKLQYSRSLIRKQARGLDAIVIPVYNEGQYALLPDQAPNQKVTEFGFHAGLGIRQNFFEDRISAYFIIAAGPHFVSGAPDRQKPRFNFSDNFYGGFNIRIKDGWHLDLRAGLRHISNANLSAPNGGINSYLLNGGVMRSF